MIQSSSASMDCTALRSPSSVKRARAESPTILDVSRNTSCGGSLSVCTSGMPFRSISRSFGI
eukprot:6714179-Prymnesium_polylepis.1